MDIKSIHSRLLMFFFCRVQYLPNGFHSSWSNITLGVCLEEKVWGAPFGSFTQSLVHVSKWDKRLLPNWPAPNTPTRSPLLPCRSQNWHPRICGRLCSLLLRAAEPGTEPRVNHCLPPPTQVTLVFHTDTQICNTAPLHDAKSHLPPRAIWGRISLQPQNLESYREKRSDPVGTARSKEVLMSYLTGEHTSSDL